MTGVTPNPCLLCGATPYYPMVYGPGGFDITCYRQLGNHALLVIGATPQECIERWNRLNPSDIPAPVTRQTIFALIRAKLRR